MSKTIYYLGAGASYGKRVEEGSGKKILEGIPVVAEIPHQFALFREFVKTAVIPADSDLIFQNTYRQSAQNIESERRELLYDIDTLIKGIQEHATIDTYARKLYLTRRFREFNKLKAVLCAFFVWAQLEYKPDGRYDTFLANVLDEGALGLPKDISIISWNYDAQMEMVYKAYSPDGRLPIYEKNIQGEWPVLTSGGRVIKINGSASFEDKSTVGYIEADKENMPAGLQVIEFYHDSQVDTQEIGLDFKTHLSFAWESSPNNDKMKDVLLKTTEDTEQVVVIGYSFPFFNRTMDREIFNGMKNLKKVYVQDVNPSAVVQSLRAVLPEDRSVSIVPIPNCEQFYLPVEL